MQYRPEIDGLRAIAVLSVIFFHAGFDLFSGGYIGVDIFFVLSGFLITTIILNEYCSESFSLLNFYERRARRILPALVFVLLVCLPFAWFLMLPQELKTFGQSLVSVATFSSNIYFWLKTGYFAPSAEELVLLHTWSLAVEEQFYVVFPVFMTLFLRYGMNRVFWLICIFVVLSLCFSEYLWRYSSAANFYLLPTRAWELLSGAIVAFLWKNRLFDSVNDKLASLISNLGFLAILFSIFYFDEKTPFPSFLSVIPILGACFVIGFFRASNRFLEFLSSKFLVSIGLVSYSTYLWHQPLFAFFRKISVTHLSEFSMVLLSLLSLIFGYLSWKFIEAPFRNKSVVSAKGILTFSICSLFLIFVIGLTLHFGHDLKAKGTLYSKLSSEREAFSSNKGLSYEGCNASLGRFTVCSTSSDAEVFLWGDSFAAHLTQFFSSGDKGLVQATMSSCFPSSEFTPYDSFGLYSLEWAKTCSKFSKDAFNYVLSSAKIKYVVISSTYNWPLSKKFVYDGRSSRSVTIQEYVDAFIEDISKLRASGKKVVLVSPIPITPNKSSKFLKCAKNMLLNSHVSTATEELPLNNCNFKYPSNLEDDFINEIARQADVDYFDPRSLLCDKDQNCSVFVDGFPVYKDWGHLTPFGARTVQEKFDAAARILALAR